MPKVAARPWCLPEKCARKRAERSHNSTISKRSNLELASWDTPLSLCSRLFHREILTKSAFVQSIHHQSNSARLSRFMQQYTKLLIKNDNHNRKVVTQCHKQPWWVSLYLGKREGSKKFHEQKSTIVNHQGFASCLEG